MTEQELRAAVAEYDAEMARELEDNNLLFAHDNGEVQWYITALGVRRDQGCYTQESDVLISHAATMRAMDAAARAFNEALGG